MSLICTWVCGFVQFFFDFLMFLVSLRTLRTLSTLTTTTTTTAKDILEKVSMMVIRGVQKTKKSWILIGWSGFSHYIGCQECPQNISGL